MSISNYHTTNIFSLALAGSIASACAQDVFKPIHDHDSSRGVHDQHSSDAVSEVPT